MERTLDGMDQWKFTEEELQMPLRSAGFNKLEAAGVDLQKVYQFFTKEGNARKGGRAAAIAIGMSSSKWDREKNIYLGICVGGAEFETFEKEWGKQHEEGYSSKQYQIAVQEKIKSWKSEIEFEEFKIANPKTLKKLREMDSSILVKTFDQFIN